MRCSACPKDAIFHQPYSGKYLCPTHLRRDVESRIRHTIRVHRWLRPGDHIGVALAGDRRSSALLVFLHGLVSTRRDTRLTAMIIQDNAHNPGIDAQLALSRECRIPVVTVPAGHVFSIGAGNTARNQQDPGKDVARDTCTWISIERIGKEHGMTKIATSRSLDDAATSVLQCLMSGDAGQLFAGQEKSDGTLPLFIHPFINIPEEEVDLYAQALGVEGESQVRRVDRKIFSGDVKILMEDFTVRHPSAKYSLVHLGEEICRAGARPGTIRICAGCGMPGQDICAGCRLESGVRT